MQKKNTILIVEDDEINYIYFETLLKDNELNIRILHAKNGQEAVNLCKNHPETEFVLMDIRLPIMNGFEATKQIKAFRPNLPIIVQTAYTTSQEKKAAFSAGCDDFYSKPISRKTLNSIVYKYLRKANKNSSLETQNNFRDLM